MRWRYQIKGSHTHVRVFKRGALCGTLCFRNEEFVFLRIDLRDQIEFIAETREYEDITNES